jgi:hypothetical protein
MRRAGAADACSMQAWDHSRLDFAGATRARADRRGWLLLLALLVTMVVATASGVAVASAAASKAGGPAARHATPPSAADRASARRIATLRRRERALVVRFDAAQALVLQQQVASESVEREQARIRGIVDRSIVALYQQGGGPDAGTLLLSASDVTEAVHAAQVTSQFAKWRRDLERQFEVVEENVAAQHHQAEVAMARMVATSHELDGVRADLDTELGKVAARKAAKARTAAAPRAAATGSAQLVAGVARTGGAAPRRNGGVIDTDYVFDTAPPPGFGGIGNLISVGQGLVGGAVTSTSAQQIDLYLMGKASPMAGTGALFIEAGQRYGMDPRLVVAISGAESSFGQQTCGAYNAWGWGCPNSPGQFASWGDGIDRVARGLRTGYLNQGLTTVAAIHNKYAPVGAANDPTGLNNNWVQNVSKFLVEMGGNPNAVATQAVVDVPAAPTTGA